MGPLIPYFDVPVLTIPIPFADFDLPLHGFGLLVASGFIIGGKVAMARARKLGLDPELINRLISWLVVGTLVGGHVGYGLMYKFDEYMADPMQWLYVWQGLSSYGGFVVCVPLSVWFFKREGVAVWPYLDCLAHGMAVGWFLGRMGCFVAHDHPGTPANDFFLAVYCTPMAEHTLHLPDWLSSGHGGPWGPCVNNDAVFAAHDMGLYEALFSLAMFGVFTLLDRKTWVPGFYPLLLGVTYAPVRFFMDFARPDSTDNRLMGFTPAQYWSIVFFLATAFFLYKRMTSGDEHVPFVVKKAAD